MIQVIQSNPPPPTIQNCVADVNKYFGIELPENNFFVRAHAGNNLSRYNFPAPPPQSESNGRLALSIDRKPDHTKIV